jgi:hypothetical protein
MDHPPTRPLAPVPAGAAGAGCRATASMDTADPDQDPRR